MAVVCGAGNNGGDGYVLARLAQAAGLDALVLAAAPPDKLGGDARRAQEEWLAAGRQRASVRGRRAVGQRRHRRRLVRHRASGRRRAPETLAVIRAINAARRPVLALDIPSGVDADSGAVHEAAVRAEITVSFVGVQVRAVPGRGPRARRAWCCSTISAWWRRRCREFTPLMRRIDESELAAGAAARARASRTRDPTAACWSSAAAPACRARCGWRARRRCASGAGLVTVAGAPENLVAVTATRPELIYLPVVARARASTRRCAPPTCSPSGPGLGTGDWAQRLWAQVLRARGDRPRWSMPTRSTCWRANPAKLPAGLDHHAASRRGRAGC